MQVRIPSLPYRDATTLVSGLLGPPTGSCSDSCSELTGIEVQCLERRLVGVHGSVDDVDKVRKNWSCRRAGKEARDHAACHSRRSRLRIDRLSFEHQGRPAERNRRQPRGPQSCTKPLSSHSCPHSSVPGCTPVLLFFRRLVEAAPHHVRHVAAHVVIAPEPSLEPSPQSHE